jgi:hypothetical protein
MIVLREYEDFYKTHRPHRTLKQAAPLRPLPDGVTDLDHFRVKRRDRAGGVIHEYRLVAQVFGTHRSYPSSRSVMCAPIANATLPPTQRCPPGIGHPAGPATVSGPGYADLHDRAAP